MNYLRVASIHEMSNGMRSQLQPRDLIIRVNGSGFESVEHFEAVIRNSNQDFTLTIIRRGRLLELVQIRNCTLGAVLVGCSDDKSLQALISDNLNTGIEEDKYAEDQREVEKTNNEAPRRLAYVLTYYVVLGIVVILFDQGLITLPTGSHRGLGKLTLLAFLLPILYLIVGKKIFK